MSKKLWALAAVLGAAALAVAAVAPGALAAEPTPATNAVIGGTGVLDARGDGLVAVKGAMDYHASGTEAVLLVKDEGGNAFINVSGYGTTFHWNGFTAYAGFHGTAHIIGGDVAVILVGRDLNVDVAGRGWAYLKGNGAYFVNGHGPFPWSPDGNFAAVTPD